MKLLQTVPLLLLVGLTCFGQDTIRFTQPTEYTTFYGQEDVNTMTMLSPDRFILSYSGGPGLVNGKIRVGTIGQDTAVAFEDAFTFMENGDPDFVKIYRLSDTSFLLSTNSGMNSEIRIGTVNANNEVVIVDTTGLPAIYRDLLVLSDTVFIGAYYDSNVNLTKCDVCKIESDYHITVDSTYILTSSYFRGDDYMSFEALTDSTFVLASGSREGSSMVGTADGNDIITFSELQLFSATSVMYNTAIMLNDTSYAIIFSDVSNSGKGAVIKAYIDTDQNITYSNKYYFSETETRGITATKLAPDTMIIAFANTGDDQNGYIVRAILTGDSIAFEDRVMYNELSTVAQSPIAPISDDRFLIMYPELLSTEGFVIMGIVAEEEVSTHTDLLNTGSFSIYPNPTNGHLNVVSNENNGPFSIQLIDSNGRTVLNQFYEANQIRLDLSEYNAGIYFLRIDNQTNVVIRKVVVY